MCHFYAFSLRSLRYTSPSKFTLCAAMASSDFLPTIPQNLPETKRPRGGKCPLCDNDDGTLVLRRSSRLRVVRVLDPHFPAFYRVVWNAHVTEFTDLLPADRQELMANVALVEDAMRSFLAGPLTPKKINLASLGNAVPHLHWHIVARYDWDTHFPQSIWAQAQRAPDMRMLAMLNDKIPKIDMQLAG
jgi:diadenosine tetraphosphate (Ap4A) HIT family hydrolase